MPTVHLKPVRIREKPHRWQHRHVASQHDQKLQCTMMSNSKYLRWHPASSAGLWWFQFVCTAADSRLQRFANYVARLASWRAQMYSAVNISLSTRRDRVTGIIRYDLMIVKCTASLVRAGIHQIRGKGTEEQAS